MVGRRLQSVSTKACKTRWLSFDKAVKAAHEDLDSILLCLSELADDATADGLLKKLKSPDWIAALYILTDVLPVLSLLSRTFQKGSINFSQIQPSIEICKLFLNKTKPCLTSSLILERVEDFISCHRTFQLLKEFLKEQAQCKSSM